MHPNPEPLTGHSDDNAKVWKLFDESDPAKAAKTLHSMLSEKMDATGINFGRFTVEWIPHSYGGTSAGGMLLRRTGRKVHISTDIGCRPAENFVSWFMIELAEQLRNNRYSHYVGSAWYTLRHLLPQLKTRPIMTEFVSSGCRCFVIYATMLSHGLKETVVPIRIKIRDTQFEDKLVAMAVEQRLLRQQLEEHDTRAKALTCCPVAAAIIADGPKWRKTVHQKSLKRAMIEGASNFRNGHYSPTIGIGRGIIWRDGKMKLPLAGLPLTIRSLLTDMPLKQLIEQEWLPEGVITSHKEVKGLLEIQVDYKPVPLLSVLPHIGLTLEQVM